MKKIFIVESCDEEEAQVFSDIVVSDSLGGAEEEIEKARDYATVIGSHGIDWEIECMERWLKRLRSLKRMGAAGVKKAEAEWKKFKKECL